MSGISETSPICENHNIEKLGIVMNFLIENQSLSPKHLKVNLAGGEADWVISTFQWKSEFFQHIVSYCSVNHLSPCVASVKGAVAFQSSCTQPCPRCVNVSGELHVVEPGERLSCGFGVGGSIPCNDQFDLTSVKWADQRSVEIRGYYLGTLFFCPGNSWQEGVIGYLD